MEKWPPLAGDYIVVNKNSPIAVVTLATNPKEMVFDNVAIVGSLRTENLGVERIITNTLSNPSIRAIIICGEESKGHLAGQALYSVWKNGVDEERKIIGAKGPIPYLENISRDEVIRFQKQIAVMENMIGVADRSVIQKKIDSIISMSLPAFGWNPVSNDSESENKL